MRFDPTAHNFDLPAYLRRFLAFAPLEMWQRRFAAFAGYIAENPLVEAHLNHAFPVERGLEMLLAMHARGQVGRPGVLDGPYSELLQQALSLVVTCAKVHPRLNETGRRVLEGRLRSSALSGQPLIPLALEMTIATHLMLADCAVDFHDMEQGGGFDFLAQKDGLSFEIDCKTISADVGRQIHRTHLYALGGRIYRDMTACMDAGGGAFLRVTLPTRLYSNHKSLAELADVVGGVLRQRHSWGEASACRVLFEEFNIALSPFSYEPITDSAIRQFIESRFRCINANSLCVYRPYTAAVLVVVDSDKPDKVLDGMYRQLKDSAHSQFSGTVPGLLVARLTGLNGNSLENLGRDRDNPNGLDAVASRLLSSPLRQHMSHMVFVASDEDLEREVLGINNGVLTRVTRSGGTTLVVRNPNHPLGQDPRLQIFRSHGKSL